MSRATELADALEEGWLENVDLDRVDVDKLQAELRRLERVNAELVEAAKPFVKLFQQADASRDQPMDSNSSVDAHIAVKDLRRLVYAADAALTTATKEQQK